MPLRARSSRPSERVPSGKTPMQAPSRSASIARSSAPRSPVPRSIGIWPMPSRIGPSPRTSQSDDFASARTWRWWRAATPTATGSMLESWFPATRTGPDRGSASSPSTSIRPHHAANGAQAAIATR